jgi:hypothetical protein
MNIATIARPAIIAIIIPASSVPAVPVFYSKKMYERSEFIYFAEQKKSCLLTEGAVSRQGLFSYEQSCP